MGQDRNRYPVTRADVLDLAAALATFALTVGPPLAALILWKG